jgi:hypothetical protein
MFHVEQGRFASLNLIVRCRPPLCIFSCRFSRRFSKWLRGPACVRPNHQRGTCCSSRFRSLKNRDNSRRNGLVQLATTVNWYSIPRRYICLGGRGRRLLVFPVTGAFGVSNCRTRKAYRRTHESRRLNAWQTFIAPGARGRIRRRRWPQ